MSAPLVASLADADAPVLVTALPGPRAREAIAADERVTSPSLPRAYGLVPRRGAGCILEDVDGNLLLDFNAGIAVTATGHCHPEIVDAIRRQAAELIHYSASDFYLPVYAELCSVLDRLFPSTQPARAFLTNSGTEAVEAAIKLARAATGRQHVIAFFGSFHGRSYGSLSLTASKARYRSGFSPLLPGVTHVPYADSFRPGVAPSSWDFSTIDYLEGVVFKRLVEPAEVAAVIVEPIQGEGGYIVPPPEWLPALRELCTRHGILLVVDEVQSGVGRTGRMWATEHVAVEPDVLVAGKGIASGAPLGAMVARADLMTWEKGAHGSTYGGNPLACAAALATIDLVERELAANAAARGRELIEGLVRLAERQPIIRAVRGLGLMIGLELESAEDAAQLELECFHRGLLALGAGDAALRLSPPLVVRPEQIEVGLRILEQACDALSTDARAAGTDDRAPTTRETGNGK